VHIRLRHMLLDTVLPNLSSEFGILSCLLFVAVKSQLIGSTVFSTERTKCIHSFVLRIHWVEDRKYASFANICPDRITIFGLTTSFDGIRVPFPLKSRSLVHPVCALYRRDSGNKADRRNRWVVRLMFVVRLQTDHPAICQLFWRGTRTPLFSLECRSYRYVTNNC
jgi:hypothetical protein